VKNRLKVLRAERDWTQADLADRLEVSRQTVNAIETGKYDPSLPLAFRIARLFEIPIEQLFSPDGDGRLEPGRAQDQVTEYEQRGRTE
jgi:putative transcriptional regulator